MDSGLALLDLRILGYVLINIEKTLQISYRIVCSLLVELTVKSALASTIDAAMIDS